MSQLPSFDDSNEMDGALAHADPSATMPLMAGMAEDPMAGEGLGEADAWGGGGSEGNKLLSQSTILIVVIAVIAAGSLYAMRLSQGDLSSSQKTKEVEAKIEGWLVRAQTNPDDPTVNGTALEEVRQTNDILDALDREHGENQVPVEYVKKNPFVVLAVVEDKPDANDGVAAQKEREKLLKRLNKELRALELQTVMDGKRKVAVIDGDFYQVGDAIKSFTITSIRPDSQTVEVTAHEETFTLSMD